MNVLLYLLSLRIFSWGFQQKRCGLFRHCYYWIAWTQRSKTQPWCWLHMSITMWIPVFKKGPLIPFQTSCNVHSTSLTLNVHTYVTNSNPNHDVYFFLLYQVVLFPKANKNQSSEGWGMRTTLLSFHNRASFVRQMCLHHWARTSIRQGIKNTIDKHKRPMQSTHRGKDDPAERKWEHTRGRGGDNETQVHRTRLSDLTDLDKPNRNCRSSD